MSLLLLLLFMLLLNFLYYLLSLFDFGLIFFRNHNFNFSNLLMLSYLFNNWFLSNLLFFIFLASPALSLIFISFFFKWVAHIYSWWLLSFLALFLHLFNTSILVFLEILLGWAFHLFLVVLVHQVFRFLSSCNFNIKISSFLLPLCHSFPLLNIILHFLPLNFSFI